MNNPFKTLLARTDLPAGYPVGSFVMSASMTSNRVFMTTSR